jgi:ketosteroid isomerase-like protein
MGSHADMIRAHFGAWNARDRDGMVRDLAEDVVVEEDQGFQVAAGVSHGHAGAFALWDQLFEVSDDARIDVLEIEEQGDGRILVLMRMHATMRQSGISGSLEMAHIWHMRGDKAARVQVFGTHEDARVALRGG